MLVQLAIYNFVIVESLIVDFNDGMTCITGETGAGKSITIDALTLCLGGRSDASMIRQHSDRADISARFSLDDTPEAQVWLRENQLDYNDDCILRRVISSDGRSKGFINGRAVPLLQLKELGQYLIKIEGQHTQQQLLKSEHQRALLDSYWQDADGRLAMKTYYQRWQQAKQSRQQWHTEQASSEAKKQLLQYQLKELDEFSPVEQEYEKMDIEYRRLANREKLVELSEHALMQLTDHDSSNALLLLHRAKKSIESLSVLDHAFSAQLSMLADALIQVGEVSQDLRHYTDRLESDPEHMLWLERRLAKQLALARKHHVAPEALPHFYQQLQADYRQLEQYERDESTLNEEVEQHYQAAMMYAKERHDARRLAANDLQSRVTTNIRELAMSHADFVIELDFSPTYLNESGADRVTFMLKSNVGQTIQPLAKIASGGELSRIALVIEVIIAQRAETPALIFDEVDVGISGQTASRVGQLMRQLSQFTQVICVTHLPQVAGNAHHHFFVTKESNAQETTTNMLSLDSIGRLNELARMLSGDKITQNTLANAKELLI